MIGGGLKAALRPPAILWHASSIKISLALGKERLTL